MKRGWTMVMAAGLLCAAGMAGCASTPPQPEAEPQQQSQAQPEPQAQHAQPQEQPQLTEVTGFGSNPGSLRMFHYVPQGLPADAPLVVVAHGCLGSAQEIAVNSGWLELADRFGIALLFPETSKENEPWAGCFRTWEAGHQQRGAGEPLSVFEMIERMQALFPVSKSRTFMAGVSSGGHLTNVMLAAYPEVFLAGAPQSSFPYRCAMAATDLGPCATGAREASASDWGDLVRSARPGYAGPWPRVQLWHGELDAVIQPAATRQLLLQWIDVHGIDAVPDREDALLSQHPRLGYADADGEVPVESVTVKGMAHAIAVDPGDGPAQCGRTDTFAADHGICAAYWISRFFGIAD